MSLWISAKKNSRQTGRCASWNHRKSSYLSRNTFESMTCLLWPPSQRGSLEYSLIKIFKGRWVYSCRSQKKKNN